MYNYFPIFILLALSGNPLFSSETYSKNLLIGYTFIFLLFFLVSNKFKIDKHILKSFALTFFFIIVLVSFQFYTLRFVSLPGVFALILKLLLVLLTLQFYLKKNINVLHVYVKVISFLSFSSIPLFVINQFSFIGLQLEDSYKKSMILYTAFQSKGEIVRNSGMFWEPGAFAGYLILGLIFIIIINKDFILGKYKRDFFIISVGLISSFSTMGYMVFSLIVLFFVLKKYKWGKFVLIPVLIILIGSVYNKLPFLKSKIEHQYVEMLSMNKYDISNTRFGALNMDLVYIKSQPIIGNGLDNKTRFRFHKWVQKDIGHGNGMSNFIAYWGIPFFVFWMFSIYIYVNRYTLSHRLAIFAVLVLLLVLQGEQFLNFPMFLMFFILPGYLEASCRINKNIIYESAMD